MLLHLQNAMELNKISHKYGYSIGENALKFYLLSDTTDWI